MAFSGSVRLNAADNRFSIRRRDKRDTDALFHVFSQPRCRQGMAVDAFGSASEVQDWFDNNSLNSFDMVATVNDTPIGFAGLSLFQGTMSHVGSMSLFVHDDFHGRGIGTLMMTALIATSDILVGLRRLQLIVFCDNERAISLYRKFGFEIEGRHESSVRRGDELMATFTMARIAPSEPVKHADMEHLCDELRNLISLLQRSQAPDAVGSQGNEVLTGCPSKHHAEARVQEIS